jgi:serine/threonine-protein kinase
MPLPSATRIGAYEILALIGQGGMGEVYRARDTRLGRDVAVKVLPSVFASDPDRMGRFEREARVLASLQHSNIAVLHGLEESGDVRALVMELVEGPTLADRIAQGPISIEEAIPIALQIVEALDYAHERGVIHRDLKPANVKLTPEGSGSKVKLLDFGLAKALTDAPVTASLPDSPTLTLGVTQAGVILGTAAYMSPEQVNGKPADRRSDIWAFGVVLYEMLTARRPFQGETTAEILSSVMKDSPPLGHLPVVMRPLLHRCLQKHPRQRLHAIGEARIALETPAPLNTVHKTRRTAVWAGVAIAVTVLAALAFSAKLMPAPADPRPSIHIAATLPPILVGSRANIALSSDGSRVVFTGGGPQQPLYVRALNEAEARPLAGTEGATNPTFSPDGQWVAYLLFRAGSGQLMKIPTTGGNSRPLSNSRFDLRIVWGGDDNIYLSSLRSLMRIPAAGGKLDTIGKPEPEGSETYRVPFQFLAGNRVLIGTVRPGDDPASEIAVLDLETGEKTVVLRNGGRASYASTGTDMNTGHIVYQGPESLVAVPFDLQRLAVRGSPVTVLAGYPLFDVSDAGTLAYVARGNSQAQFGLAWIDRQGREHPGLEWVQATLGITTPPRLSPKGDRLVLVDRGDVWVYDLMSRTRIRLTSDGKNSIAVWTADGKNVIYSAGARTARIGGALVSAPADNSGPPQSLLDDGMNYVPQGVTPDGRKLIARQTTLDDSGSIYVAVSLDGQARREPPERVFQSAYQVTGVQVSPDGRLMAYQSNEAGRSEVYMTPFPGPGARTPISSSGGSAPRWSGNGELFFVDASGRLIAVEIQSSPTLRVGQPKALFEGATGGFESAAGGQRFLMPRPIVADAKPSELHIVVNWVDDLRRRVP